MSQRLLQILAKQYPDAEQVCTEIINLQAILNLPKGTEHFLSDIHGEYESFLHVLKNASGSIRQKIMLNFGDTLNEQEQKDLAVLIYYPEQYLKEKLKTTLQASVFFQDTIEKLIILCRSAASKYSRSKVNKALPKEFAYIISELLHQQPENKQEYYRQIIRSIIQIGRAERFIILLSGLIQRFVVDHLHIIGDIYDRGPGADIILDNLLEYHSVDVQWGNHDILWMGAAAGSLPCMANVLRISLRYGNLKTVEEGYGINLRFLATFAMEVYKNDPCTLFLTSEVNSSEFSGLKEKELVAKMHKAISVIQFKLEGQLIKRRPRFGMKNRLLLEDINYQTGTILLEGKTYKLTDTNFPTVDPQAPYKLSAEEEEIVQNMENSFLNNEKLHKHVRFLYGNGSMYLTYNANLLYHGCILLNEDASFTTVDIQGKDYKGKALMDKFDKLARQGYFSKHKEERSYGQDILWYLWCGVYSPLFGKHKMTTFERYFIAEKETHKEHENAYYSLRDNKYVCLKILEEFGLSSEHSCIINGHVPVKVKKGESPVKADGKLYVIDGGFAKAYQNVTGIAGYTLVFNSHGLHLVAHAPFESVAHAIDKKSDIVSSSVLFQPVEKRLMVKDTDIGVKIKRDIEDLQSLLKAYENGDIK